MALSFPHGCTGEEFLFVSTSTVELRAFAGAESHP